MMIPEVEEVITVVAVHAEEMTTLIITVHVHHQTHITLNTRKGRGQIHLIIMIIVLIILLRDQREVISKMKMAVTEHHLHHHIILIVVVVTTMAMMTVTITTVDSLLVVVIGSLLRQEKVVLVDVKRERKKSCVENFVFLLIHPCSLFYKRSLYSGKVLLFTSPSFILFYFLVVFSVFKHNATPVQTQFQTQKY